jgi:hypothetical protein
MKAVNFSNSRLFIISKPSGLELDAAARKIASPAVFVVHYADIRPLDIARPTRLGG